MRLIKFLNEGVIRVNLKWLENLLNIVEKTCLFKSEQAILNNLNKGFEKYHVIFKMVNRKQAIDDWMAAAGVNYASVDSKPPFWITIYLDDLLIFEDKENFWQWKDAILRILKHERLHREQFIRILANKAKITAGGYKSREDYLSDPKEIMALAYDTYLQLLAQDLDVHDFEQVEDLSNLEDFLGFFPPNSPERKQFIKYLGLYWNK